MWHSLDLNTGLYSNFEANKDVQAACIRKHRSLDKYKCAVLSVLTELEKFNSDEITIAGFNAHEINAFIKCVRSMYTERILLMM